MRKPLIAGNAKMNLNRSDLKALLSGLLEAEKEGEWKADVLYCPPFTLLDTANRTLEGDAVALGAQDMYWESSGAFTGEVSADMLLETGCRYVILGHSERRALFGETDDSVARKAVRAMEAGLIPIVCVGETQAERDAGNTLSVLSTQVAGSTRGLNPSTGLDLVLAYEPVWAIGTGLVATPEQAQEAHAHIRQEVQKGIGEDLAREIRILYGGSVKPSNARELLSCPDIDGALVGGASLDVASFAGIIAGA